MNNSLSPNAQAILLLTAPLIVGRGDSSPQLLTLGEYNRLARALRERQCQPADLLGVRAAELLRQCHNIADRTRLERLLERGFLLSQAIERWRARAIWVVSRADPDYPARLKARLKEDAPPAIYGCGEATLLDTGGLAVVGSRHVDDVLIHYAEDIGRLAAEARCTVISGGARGIDQAAMRGALETGGRVAGVLVESLERAVLSRDHREVLMGGRLVLISPYDPAAGFNVGHAMQRNKLIYALSDAALVVSSEFENGGTWTGAIEQLEKWRLVPIYVRSVGHVGKGLEELVRRGASRWPEPKTPEAFMDALSTALHQPEVDRGQEPLPFSMPDGPHDAHVSEPHTSYGQYESSSEAAIEVATPAAALFAKVKDLLQRMEGSKSEVEVAAYLQVSKTQAKEWLQRLVKEGVLEKLSKPIRYRSATKTERLL